MKPLTFTWNAVTNDAQGSSLPFTPSYKLYAALSNSPYGAPLVTTSDISAVVAMPTAGNYKACVTASGPDGDSAQSNQVNFTSVPQIPAAPTGLTVS